MCNSVLFSAADGVSLLAAAIRYFVRDEAQHCPKVLISTHYSEIMLPSILPHSRHIEHLTMSFLVSAATAASATSESAAVCDELVFLYRLSPKKDEPTASFGTYCAQLAGVPAHVIQRAIQVASFLNAGIALPPLPPRHGGDSSAASTTVTPIDSRDERCVALFREFVEHYEPARTAEFLQWATSEQAPNSAAH